ncbi:MAG: hypothetical protein R3C41_11610 [Calditrichia bacterium]
MIVLLIIFAFAQTPEAAKAFNDANTALRNRDTQGAIEKYQEGLSKTPALLWHSHGLGNAYKQNNDYVNAESAYKSY